VVPKRHSRKQVAISIPFGLRKPDGAFGGRVAFFRTIAFDAVRSNEPQPSVVRVEAFDVGLFLGSARKIEEMLELKNGVPAEMGRVLLQPGEPLEATSLVARDPEVALVKHNGGEALSNIDIPVDFCLCRVELECGDVRSCGW
jgi:hypothetical protein